MSKHITYFILLFIINNLSAQRQSFTESPLFENGSKGYACYRIPAIIKANNGDLLAFAEGRVKGCNDFGNVDIVLKRSNDNGQTWSKQQVVVGNGSLQAGNPAPVLDALDPKYANGRLFLFYNTGTASEHATRNGKGVREVWYTTSTDHGVNWSDGINITSQVHKPNQPNFNKDYQFKEDWRTHANTPGHALQLKKGKYAGRLYIPANHSAGDPQKGFNEYRAYAFYSDDHGKNWHISNEINIPSSNEAIAAELSDGRVMLNCRHQNGESKKRIVAISSDGGTSWDTTYFDAQLPSPVCQASLLSYSAPNNRNALLFSNPYNTKSRNNMTVKVSYDDGATWAVQREIRSGESAYSDLVQLQNGEIGLLYEHGNDNGIHYAQFNNKWLLGASNINLKYILPTTADVIVVGDGTGATSAAIQSARSGASTILVTSLPWLGGMLTSAGVSATDGNHRLPAGLWGEFRDSLRKHYGGADSLFTGWVSNTMFEPHIGDYYWKQMANKEEQLTIYYNTVWDTLYYENQWTVSISKNGQTFPLQGKLLIDGTDLGDVAAAAGVTFDIGMDSRVHTKEDMASATANSIIQDLTYAVILKDYGEGVDKTIPKPDNYDPSLFYCSCQQNCKEETITKVHPCDKMLSYGKLPNGKYMINWPLKGNDFYVNVIEKNNSERAAILNKAKNKTLQFLYYIQTELGYKNLGITDDEFPTVDGLALMPYHREGRRIHGLNQLTVNDILQPYEYDLYQSGIAVGDYPIDHHHYERPDAPEIDFPKVPSFSIPLGTLIPKGVDHLLIADKAISVTNIVNGASRLQPVILQVGQAAGVLAAMAVKGKITPREVSIRKIQQEVLSYHGYLQPFIDIPLTHPHFESIQRIGSTGILRGTGIPYKWANQTWFYPDSTIIASTLEKDISASISSFTFNKNKEALTIQEAINFVYHWKRNNAGKTTNEKNYSFVKAVESNWEKQWKLSNFQLQRPITRLELAVLIDTIIDPFSVEIEHTVK